MFFLIGCESQDHTIYFKESMILEYNSENSPLTLIESIGTTEVTEDMINGNTLTCGNFIVKCEDVDTSVLTTYQVKYSTNDTENRWITKTISIKDMSAPTITLKGLDSSDCISLTSNELKTYNFSKNIQVKDNYDTNPTIEVNVQDKVKNEQYTIMVTATDCFDNSSEKSFTVNIKPEQSNTAQNKETNNSESEKKSSNTSESGTSNKFSGSEKKSESVSKDNSIKEQNFMFGKTYELNGKNVKCTMQNVQEICTSRLSKSGKSGSCTPIKDSNGIYIGMSLKFY